MFSAASSIASRAPRQGRASLPCRVAVIWIDWYPYHVARFRGLLNTPALAGRVAGIELVGGVGVHAGLKFREPLPEDLPVQTLEPRGDWQGTNKRRLSVRLWKTLTALDPELVLVPGYYTLPGIAAALWARCYGRSAVLMTESTEQDHARVRWREQAKSLLLRTLFDWAVVGGTAHRRYLARLRFPIDRIAGFYDVVDNAGIARATASLRDAAKDGSVRPPFFLYVGRLAPEKNVLGLVRSWLAYREGGGTWDLVLAGDGPERYAIASALEASPVARHVRCTGLLPAKELAPLYAGAGCFVLPSTREPWGLVVNEAMAASLPVLVSRSCGAAGDLVRDGENGFLFDSPSGTPAEPARRSAQAARDDLLTGLLHRVASLPFDARRRMGARSASLIRPFSPEAFGGEIARVLGMVRPTPFLSSVTRS